MDKNYAAVDRYLARYGIKVNRVHGRYEEPKRETILQATPRHAKTGTQVREEMFSIEAGRSYVIEMVRPSGEKYGLDPTYCIEGEARQVSTMTLFVDRVTRYKDRLVLSCRGRDRYGHVMNGDFTYYLTTDASYKRDTYIRAIKER